MIHALHRVTDFTIVGTYRLRVAFRDGTMREIDFEPVLSGSLYGPLRDVGLFNRVRLDPEAHTLVWPNGADFDPATLHDWPEHLPDLAERARRWSSHDLLILRQEKASASKEPCKTLDQVVTELADQEAGNGESYGGQRSP